MNRKQKATQIFSKTNSIKKITNNHYIVNSQNSDQKYNVQKLKDIDVWTCECGDFHYRLRKLEDKHCKHIQACVILQDNISIQNKIEKIELPKLCPRCYSTTIKKKWV